MANHNPFYDATLSWQSPEECCTDSSVASITHNNLLIKAPHCVYVHPHEPLHDILSLLHISLPNLKKLSPSFQLFLFKELTNLSSWKAINNTCTLQPQRASKGDIPKLTNACFNCAKIQQAKAIHPKRFPYHDNDASNTPQVICLCTLFERQFEDNKLQRADFVTLSKTISTNI